MPEYPKQFIELCQAVTAKRPKTVIDHILKYGQITTEELKEKYGYNHPPRAVRDVRESGIPKKYSHIAMRQVRWVDLLWQGDEVEQYEFLKEKVSSDEKDMPEFIKEIISKELNKIT